MRFYEYIGSISEIWGDGREIILDDINDDTKPPVRLTVISKGMREYLINREWRDEEERYMNQRWIFDVSCNLAAIEIPGDCSELGGITEAPAKAIVCKMPELLSEEVRIFGPSELINERKPKAMDAQGLNEYWAFCNKHGLRPKNRS